MNLLTKVAMALGISASPSITISSPPLQVDEKFNQSMAVILEHEGGLSTDKRDPGSTTKWGVSLRFLRTIGLDVDGDHDVDSDDIIALTEPNAVSLYRKYWWDKYQYNRLNNVLIAAKLFDLSVNMGAKPAHKILQKACNVFLKKPLLVDGVLGKNTINAANSINPLSLRQAMRDCAKEKYMQILAANPAMEWARKGWLNRAAW